jgi:hypothetical protein
MRALIACDSTEVSEDRRADLREAARFFRNQLGVKHCLAQAKAATTTNGIAPASPEQIQAFVRTVNRYQFSISKGALAAGSARSARQSLLANFGATLATTSDQHEGTADDPIGPL